MKFLQLTFRFEYREFMETILDRHSVDKYACYPLMEGKDIEGKLHGSKVFPGNMTIIQAEVDERSVEELFKSLRKFKEEKQSH